MPLVVLSGLAGTLPLLWAGSWLPREAGPVRRPSEIAFGGYTGPPSHPHDGPWFLAPRTILLFALRIDRPRLALARLSLGRAHALATTLAQHVQRAGLPVVALVPLGSLRRFAPEIGDVTLLAVAARDRHA